ncbi:MAG: hypothetical protein L6R30_13230 [Thermoanaerobaculia bacterium]|nr:hypothetical protein [Thermoanaerobaculia bacterium]
MMRNVLNAVAIVFGLLGLSAQAADTSPLEFEPRVGNTGAKVVLKKGVSKDAVVKFGGAPVAVYRDEAGSWFVVPDGAKSSFIEVEEKGRTVAKSAVPFVVAGGQMTAPAKLIGLKEAIDVFGYADPVPEGGTAPESRVRPVLKLDDVEILTLGEPPLQLPQPAVQLNDFGSYAKGPLGYGFMITARPPKAKKPTPTPVPPN